MPDIHLMCLTCKLIRQLQKHDPDSKYIDQLRSYMAAQGALVDDDFRVMRYNNQTILIGA